MGQIITEQGNGYRKAVAVIVQDVLKAHELLTRQRRQEAIDTLASLRSLIASVADAAELGRAQAKRDHEMLEHQKEELILRSNALFEQERETLRAIADLKRQITVDQANQQIVEKDEYALKVRIAEVSQRLNTAREHADELKKWFWVPGYGTYLAARTVIEGDVQVLISSQGEWESLIRADEDLRKVLARLEQALIKLERELVETEDRVQALAKIRQDIDLRKGEASRRLVMMMKVDDLFARLEVRISDIQSKVVDVADVVEQLQGNIVLSVDPDGREVLLSMRAALDSFATALDQGGTPRL
ncbi:hypothetical protein N825_04645 [Skermanella stibiiresistens SB22]|uniref:Uncharacterized protein n=1 Tax=Skermanella stibiiresistens SB22 TaxID=1385369 RepID=W9H153_9PROT|nr:hypothetical protein [Skermanella stibiiresistens]EWY39910.1 hypothetical protein N825_04645 [Skermanella stibiiresistens SB22]